MDWAERMAGPDEAIDDALGDEIEFAADGQNYVPLKCFVYPAGVEAEISFANLDPISGKDRMLVAKAKIPVPTRAMRMKVPQLADPAQTHWAAENWVPVRAGRYWMIDLQKAVT